MRQILTRLSFTLSLGYALNEYRRPPILFGILFGYGPYLSLLNKRSTNTLAQSPHADGYALRFIHFYLKA